MADCPVQTPVQRTHRLASLELLKSLKQVRKHTPECRVRQLLRVTLHSLATSLKEPTAEHLEAQNPMNLSSKALQPIHQLPVLMWVRASDDNNVGAYSTVLIQ